MKFDFQQIFCEVLSGFAAILGVLSWAEVANTLKLQEVVSWIGRDLSIGKITAAVLSAYLVGLIVDAIALVFDELIVDNWEIVENHMKTGDRSLFLAKAPEHVLSFWETQWAYISCYRNLLMLLPFLAIPGAILINRAAGPSWTLFFLFLSFGFGVCLVVAIRQLLSYYFRIESKFSEGLCASPGISKEV